MTSYTVNIEKPKNAWNCLALVTDVEATVSFFTLKPNQKWNLPLSGTVTKKIGVFKIPRAVFMGGCSYLGLRTQKMLENPNPFLTEPYYRQLVQFPRRS